MTSNKVDFHLVLLVPDTEESVLFSAKHGEKISVSVQKLIKEEPNPDIKFEFTGFERGRYKMVCANEITKTWAIDIAGKLEGL